MSFFCVTLMDKVGSTNSRQQSIVYAVMQCVLYCNIRNNAWLVAPCLYPSVRTSGGDYTELLRIPAAQPCSNLWRQFHETISILQRRGERRATINEEVGGVYDVNVLYRGYVKLTNTKNSKTNVYTFVLHRARLKSIMHP